MGMFDSFYVNEKEIQTKELDNTLSVYTIGSVVPNMYKDGKSCDSYYIIENHYQDTVNDYGLIIIKNIFIDFVIAEKSEIKNDTELVFNFHLKRPQYTASRLTEIIKDNLYPRHKDTISLLNQVNLAIFYYEQYEKDPNGTTFFSDDYLAKFKSGLTLYDVIKDLDISKFLSNR